MNRPFVIGLGLVMLLASAALAGSGGFLGVILEPVDDDIREEADYDGKGVYVSDLVDEGPAEDAGIEQGDIITELDGDSVIGVGHLKDLLAYHSPGDKVKVKVWREGKRQTVEVELGKRKSMADEIRRKIKKKITIHEAPKAWLGVKLQSLGSQLAEYFGVEKGVLISEVFDDSPAASAGLKAGDVVIEVDGKEIEEPSEFQKLVGKGEPGNKMSLGLIRSENKLTIDVELGDVPEDQEEWYEKSSWFGGPHCEWLPFFKGHCPREVDVEVFTDHDFDFEDHERFREQLEDELEDLRAELEELKLQLKARE
jgi:S1-C subfamily serine protease